MKDRIKQTSILISILILISSCKKEPPPPTADFSFTGDNAPAPCQISFINQSTNADSYSWEFGDRTISKEENPKHTYNTEGNYTVKLTVNGEGGSISISKSLVVLEAEPTAATINFTVTGDQNLEQTIYSSAILGLANYISKSNSDFFDFSVKNPRANSNLKIVIQASNLNSETVFQTQMVTKGQTYTFSPLIKWNYDYLRSLKQPGNVDLTFVCYINDKEIDRKNLRFNYRPANECVYGLIDKDGHYQDWKWMFAAYVNEDNPNIDLLLQESLSYNVINSFIGYQGTEDDVVNQVSAIWYYLQAHSVKYSSITANSNTSQRVFCQSVRFFNDVYNNSQANCAEGTVFLASILRKIGINPRLIFVPGHMYLGYYTISDKSKWRLLETTLVGNVNLAEVYEDTQYVYNLEKYRQYISDATYTAYFNNSVSLNFVKREISRRSLSEAINYQINNFNNNISKFNDPNNHDYKIYDLTELRKVVQPIGNKK